MSVKLTILGSGSSGNCAYVETAEARILVDAGFSPLQIRKRLATIGKTPENLSAILVTHEHSDHIAGILGLADKFHIPVYCNRGTQDGTIWAFKAKWDSKKKPVFEGMDGTEHLKSKIDWRLFETGASFEVGDVGIETFSIPHDAQDPVGFILRTASGTIGFATDLGHVTKLVLQRIRAANVLVLESNHDVKMLQDCPRRSWALKQRILGRHGHISNVTAAETVAQIISADLRQLYLAHLSRECNKPELAEHIMAEQLHQLGAKHVGLQIAAQDVPCATLQL
ncbi:MAG TPA: MBL fold metallo-hydrolase [Candidatus Acidoferrales bacterium]|nr:MBL fold metallo-hydrolase [Candidatus Acidoferrales bacterium]